MISMIYAVFLAHVFGLFDLCLSLSKIEHNQS